MTAAGPIARYNRTFAERCAEQVITAEGATGYLTLSFPRMYDINFVLVEDAARPFRQLVDTAEEIMAGTGLRHRKLLLDDERHGARIADDARRVDGWEVSRLVDMAWGADPGGPDDLAAELELEDVREFRERQHRAAYGDDDDLIRQFLGRDYVYREAGDARFFGVRDRDGLVQCSLNLFRLGEVAEIDDVQTAEHARGRGYARAAVLAAARAARRDGAGVVFLCADADDWPKDLYARLGFAPAARRWELLCTPVAART